MVLLSNILLIGAALVGFGQAAGIAELAGQLPKCGLTCLTTAVSASTCSFTDSTCLCSDTALLANATACIATACTPREQLKVAKIQEEGCGVPVVSKQLKLRIITWVFFVLAEVAIIIRVWTKMHILDRLTVDDWVVVFSGFAAIAFLYLLLELIELGLGLNMYDCNPDDLSKFFRMFWAEEIVYLYLVAIPKISLLLFLTTIFPAKHFRYICWTVGFLTVAISVSFSMATIFVCSPVKYFWNRWEGPTVATGHCNNLNLQTFFAAGVNIVQDFVILLLPIPELWKLQISGKKKVQLLCMFSVGLFVSIISIIRLQYLVTYGNTTNPTMDYVEIVIWSIIEPMMAIVCACMPSIRQLLGHLWKNGFFGSTIKGSSRNGSKSASHHIYHNRSFKIENRLRSTNDDFHELSSVTNIIESEEQDHSTDKYKLGSLPKHEVTDFTVDVHERT